MWEGYVVVVGMKSKPAGLQPNTQQSQVFPQALQTLQALKSDIETQLLDSFSTPNDCS
jgi:hypothetical protein